MSLRVGLDASLGPAPLVLALLAVAGYLAAAWPAPSALAAAVDPAPAAAPAGPGTVPPPRQGAWWLLLAWLVHGALLVLDVTGLGRAQPGARLGFGPVLSLAVWLVVAVYLVESRLLPLPGVRRALAMAGVVGVLLAWAFPGEVQRALSAWTPLHWAMGVASYGLLGAAVLHGLMLDAAERSLRPSAESAAVGASGMVGRAGWVGGRRGPLGLPLLRLEKLTFRFVEAGFLVLSLAVLLGLFTAEPLRVTHKLVFSLLGWAVFAALLWGRHARGWRGRRATRWLYVGAALLLLGYAGSRFVFEVLLGRSAWG